MLDPSRVARRVRTLREAAGKNRETLAVNAGVSKSTIDNLEQGKALPKIETLDRIAEALGVPLTSLLSEDTEAARRQPILAGCAA